MIRMTTGRTWKRRPVRWPADEEFRQVIGETTRPGDRLILLALRLHDLEPDNPRAAYPGYNRIAELTGLSKSYVRNRLSELARSWVLFRKKRGRMSHYFIVPPSDRNHLRETISDTGHLEAVTPGAEDERIPQVTGGSSTRPALVTDMSPPERHYKGNYKGKEESEDIRDGGYPNEFEAYWDAHPNKTRTTKTEAFDRWKQRIWPVLLRLPPDDRVVASRQHAARIPTDAPEAAPNRPKAANSPPAAGSSLALQAGGEAAEGVQDAPAGVPDAGREQ
jgi:hypothetical protein